MKTISTYMSLLAIVPFLGGCVTYPYGSATAYGPGYASGPGYYGAPYGAYGEPYFVYGSMNYYRYGGRYYYYDHGHRNYVSNLPSGGYYYARGGHNNNYPAAQRHGNGSTAVVNRPNYATPQTARAPQTMMNHSNGPTRTAGASHQSTPQAAPRMHQGSAPVAPKKSTNQTDKTRQNGH
jgi:hypothetical protein